MEKFDVRNMRSYKKEDEDNNKLAEICSLICFYYERLTKELSAVNKFFGMVEKCSSAYSDRHMVETSIKKSTIKIKPDTLKTISKELETVQKGAGNEFSQGINFGNIKNSIPIENLKENIVIFVWNQKKKLQYISYQLYRIVNAENMHKKVAILKGMIAYY